MEPSYLQGTQVTASENHPEWKRRNKSGFPGDIGGPFSSTTKEVTLIGGPFSFSGAQTNVFPGGVAESTNWYSYKGFCLPWSGLVGGVSFPYVSKSNDITLDAWGAKAIAQCKPTNRVADLSTFLGETLKEGIPRMFGAKDRWKLQTERALEVPANEYLAVEFGWKPIINDILAVSDAIYRTEKTLRQFERDSGRVVRRRFSFPPTILEESSTVVADGVKPYLTPGHSAMDVGAPAEGKVVMVRKHQIDRWFSGAFTYYLPNDGESRFGMTRGALEAKKLLGLAPTPDVIWNLTPWSWAVDWFSNAGDVLSNVTDWAADGLVLRYGYIMERSTVSETYAFVGPTGKTYGIRPSVVQVVAQSKVRRKATPFGFGLTWNGLTPRQLAIITSLGITKH
jgi:hypothetical protein